MSITARRSKKGTEADEPSLGVEWTCLLNILRQHNKDLRMWPLAEIYRRQTDEYGERIPLKLPFDLSPAVLAELDQWRAVTFNESRHLGMEPFGIEIFEKNAGKGCDPKMNTEEKSIVADFFRNTDNWVGLPECLCLLLFARCSTLLLPQWDPSMVGCWGWP
jgi:hypothetical protein